MGFEEFVGLDRSDVTAMMRKRGDIAAVFWTNGTRRWFLSQTLSGSVSMPAGMSLGQAYAEATAEQTAWALDLLLDHGIQTILWPAVHWSNLYRGGEYIDQYLLPLIENLCSGPAYRRILEKHQVRFQFYGEMEEQMTAGQRARYLQAVRNLAEETRGYGEKRLFVGFCPSDGASTATKTLRKLAASGMRPDEITREDFIRGYYGDEIIKVDLTIAHGRMSYFGTPFFTPGDLYFQVSPSLFIDELCLRKILYDFLVSRPIDDWNYDTVPEGRWQDMATFFEQNKHQVVGTGRRSADGKIWSVSCADASDPEVSRRLFADAPPLVPAVA